MPYAVAPQKTASLPTRVAAALLALFLNSSAQAQPDEANCGAPPHADICIGNLNVPAKFKEKFRQGAQQAVTAVFSDKFQPVLAAFIARHADAPTIAEPWKGHDAPSIVGGERAHFTKAINVVTKGGVRGWLSKTFSGNVANEGVDKPDGSRDIPVNLFGMARASTGDIANTIAHEVGHAAGLHHPDSERKNGLPRAFCEPPYVIGSLVRQIAEGDAWRFNPSLDCRCFKPEADQDNCVP